MTVTASTGRRSTKEVVGAVAGEYVTELQRGYRADTSAAAATLAQLRRGAGRLPQDMPELWGLTGAERLYQALPSSGSDTDASRAEGAMFLAVTLYALHQQSRPDLGMHKAGIDLGAAVRRLMPNGEIDEPIRRRFTRAGTATTLSTLAYRLREIVSLLRRESVPLDYALLAQHLYQAQLPGGMQQVRQSWGRSFHAHRPQTPESTSAPDGETTTNEENK
ncbi:MAG: CRISPR-associated protein Cse2 family [Gemmatimonadales bacterium]|nr:CRISPR-associated protein Cse2 family [Gemmatimonadales bacterium]